MLLIATDVFGNTPAVAALARQFAQAALIVSPFADDSRTFRSEQEAYQAFLAEGGIAAYAEKLQRMLEQHPQLQSAVGFSAGASALWINSEREAMRQLRQTVLFYGSRIREYREVRPLCPVRLIFSEKEAAFNPAELVADLRQRGHQAEIVKATRHGFMNAYSSGYCVKSHTRFINELSLSLNALPVNAAA